jgi:hypothetical protein
MKTSVYRVSLMLALLLFIWLATRDINRPGLHYDEALHARPAINLIRADAEAARGQFATISARGLPFPVMSMDYMGALKSYLLAPAFLIFGVKVSVLRWTMVMVAALGLFFSAQFAKEAFGSLAATIGAWLLATDPSLIIFSRTDWGPVAIAFALRGAALFFLMRWWRSGGHRAPLVIACALIGLGVYDKASFFWFVFALIPVGLALWLTSRDRPRLTIKTLALAIAAGLVGSLPFWVFNVLYGWRTLLAILTPAQRSSLGALLQQAPARTGALLSMFEGRATDVWMFGHSISPQWGVASTLLWPLTIAAIVLLLIISLATQRWKLLAMPALMALVLLQIYLTPRPVWAHHWIGIYPFPQLLIGLTLAEAWKAAARRHLNRSAVAALGTLVVLPAVVFNLLVMNGYHQLMREHGGVFPWSDAIYPLADTLKSEYPGRRVQALAWGIGHQLHFLSAAKLPAQDPFRQGSNVSERADFLSPLVTDPANVFVLLFDPSSDAVSSGSRAALDEAARRTCAAAKGERHIADSRGQNVYTLIEFSPRRCRDTPS